MNGELIVVRQLPVIEEQLRAVKAEIEASVSEAVALVCTEDTIQSVKSRRAELRKQFDELEAQRKAVKSAVLAPYEQFETVYRDCVAGPFKAADAALKVKIAEVEDVQKAECEKKCRAYFLELCAVHGLEWLRYEQAGLKISLTEAKKKTPSGLFAQLSEFVARVACDLDAIGDTIAKDGPSNLEVLAEYKANGLNLAKAQKTVRDRREAAEAERKAAEERAERQKREAAAVAKVDAAAPVMAPPVAVEVPKEEKLLTVTFRATGTRSQLIKVREFMKQEGISYE